MESNKGAVSESDLTADRKSQIQEERRFRTLIINGSILLAVRLFVYFLMIAKKIGNTLNKIF